MDESLMRKLIDPELLDNYDASAGFDLEHLEEFVPNLTKQEIQALKNDPGGRRVDGYKAENIRARKKRRWTSSLRIIFPRRRIFVRKRIQAERYVPSIYEKCKNDSCFGRI